MTTRDLEAELAEARRDARSWRLQSEHHRAGWATAEHENDRLRRDLADALRRLDVASGLLARWSKAADSVGDKTDDALVNDTDAFLNATPGTQGRETQPKEGTP